MIAEILFFSILMMSVPSGKAKFNFLFLLVFFFVHFLCESAAKWYTYMHIAIISSYLINIYQHILKTTNITLKRLQRNDKHLSAWMQNNGSNMSIQSLSPFFFVFHCMQNRNCTWFQSHLYTSTFSKCSSSIGPSTAQE